jgi:tRNA G46 methylase TrmB
MRLKDHNSSRKVKSSQAGLHPWLRLKLQKHLETQWRQPLHAPTVAAFEALTESVGFDPEQKIVFDSGCGSGESTRCIASMLPDCLVIGIDKSQARLQRLNCGQFPHREGNAIWLRAELSSFWRLAGHAGWRLYRHYLLYPNPWPKPGHLQRRWHAHPVFPAMLALGGRLEMRCNWKIYADEFSAAIRWATGYDAAVSTTTDREITTPFERKFRQSGHGLYAVVVPAEANRLIEL